MAIQTQTSHINKNGNRTTGFVVQVRELKAASRSGVVRLSDISLHIDSGEHITLAGYTPSGKALLMEVLAGLHPPLKGEVLIDGVELYPNRKVFAPYLGVVPTTLSLPETLTPREILNYEARLRLPRGTSRQAHQQRVQEVLENLGLAAAADHRLTELSSSQQWLTSIGVELIHHPGLLLVNEPAFNLDSAEEFSITRILHNLSERGITIVQACDLSKSAQIADKVIELAPDGSLAWFGPADRAIAYFRSLALAKAGSEAAFSLEDAHEFIANSQLPAEEAWSKRFQAQPDYTTYVDNPLNNKYPDLLLQDRPLSVFRGAAKEKTPPPRIPQIGGVAKFNLLVNREFRELFRRPTGLMMLLAPPLVALCDFLIASPTMFDPLLGDPVRVPIVLGFVVFVAMLVAALLVDNEIVREQALHRREKRTGSLTLPYILSKVWLVILLAVYQGIVWTIIHFFASGMQGGLITFQAVWMTMALVALIGGVVGLIASALTRTPQAAGKMAILLVIPQLLLSGSLLPLSQLPEMAKIVTFGNPQRHAFETMLALSGYGHDVALDACWKLPEKQRNALTDTEKQACTCLGDNLFSRCRFPGIHKFFTVAIEQPQPVRPTPSSDLNNLPVQPVLRPDESIAEYSQAVEAYTLQLEQYQSRVDTFNTSLAQYMQNLANWQRSRSLIIGNAEGVINVANNQYGHAFLVDPIQDWFILSGMSLVLILLLTGIQLIRGNRI